MRARAFVLGALAFALGAAACVPPRPVERRAGGDIVEGRFIEPRAYEAYAIGAIAEADGRLDDATQSYRAAARLDAGGAEAWARQGAVACAQRQFEAADEAFREGLARDAHAAPVLRERARCDLARGRHAEAREAAELLTVVDPRAEESFALYAAALDAAGAHGEAVRLWVSLVLDHPERVEWARALAVSAERAGNVAAARLARERVATYAAGTLSPAVPASPPPRDVVAPPRPDLAAIDRALVAGDMPGAERLAAAARLPRAELALRALLVGNLKDAEHYARVVADADPHDPRALVALFAIADARDAAALPALARRATAVPFTALSPLGQLVLADVLTRRVSPDAGRAVLGDVIVAPPGDLLAVDLVASLTARLAPR